MISKKQFLQEVLADKADLPSGKAVRGVPYLGPFADWDYYFLRASISWSPNSTDPKSLNRVSVPQGFVTDLASIPRIAWWLLPRQERYTHPAIIHDYLYWIQDIIGGKPHADTVFLYAMRDFNVPWWKRSIIYYGVSLFGRRAWNLNRSLRELGERRILKKFPIDPLTTWQAWKRDPDVFA
jgi:Protein of unknown function (DUF1353)